MNDGGLVDDPKLYRRLVELICLTITQPYIFYTTSIVSQFMTFSGMRILKCLKGTSSHGLLY